MQLLTRGNLQLAAYGLFIVVVMLLPFVMDVFWLNRIAKYLVFGMLGIAISMSWGYAGILNLGQGSVLRLRRLHAGDVVETGESDKPATGVRR